MGDVHTAEQRSRNMAAIRGKDTAPEMFVRRMLHGFGFRYSLHKKGLPGRPDLVFPSRQKIIFVHGCYWHMHNCKQGAVVEATRTEFWQAKRKGNVARDRKNLALLAEQGWQVLVVWACETRDAKSLAERLVAFLKA
jgi:DNA mismatch endonuclease (patch repair protein)